MAQIAAPALRLATWTDRSSNMLLEFYANQLYAGHSELFARLFRKNAQNLFQDTGIVVLEKNMNIETANVHALMRGIPQQTFKLSQLSTQQKQAIMSSLNSRNISVVTECQYHQVYSLIIHALP